MSSAVNLMSAVNVEGPVGAIRRNRVEMSVVQFAPGLAVEVPAWIVYVSAC